MSDTLRILFDVVNAIAVVYFIVVLRRMRHVIESQRRALTALIRTDRDVDRVFDWEPGTTQRLIEGGEL